jgi:hypothetical protein
MARQIHADEIKKELRNAKGWLESDDPFFDEIDRIILNRTEHEPRVLNETSTAKCTCLIRIY